MPIELHPKWGEWSDALRELHEANQRYREAKQRDDAGLPAYKRELEKAKERYDSISADID